jgi:hypothetical protein
MCANLNIEALLKSHARTLTPPTDKPLVSYPLPSRWVPPSPDAPSVCEAFPFPRCT